MSINHHNYEEFFILYLDNELAPEERRVVEAFVQQHPDLKAELDLLKQYKLQPDESIVYAGKEDLLKMNGHDLITLSNYDEWFVLYIDNELSSAEKKMVDEFLSEHPGLLHELYTFRKSKLQPETLILADKTGLYRREETSQRRIPSVWWRAAAAVLIFAIGLTAILVLNKKTSTSPAEVAVTPVEKQKINPVGLPVEKESNNPVAISDDPAERVPEQTPVENHGRQRQQVNDQLATNQENKTAVKTLPLKSTQPVTTETQGVAHTNRPSNNLPQPLPERINTNAIETATVDIPAEIKNPNRNSLTNGHVTTQTTPPSYAVNTSAETDEELHQDSGKKNKLRGFFRKVTRTFEKRTQIDATDNDRLLVGGLAIKLK